MRVASYGEIGADTIDERLHAERVDRATRGHRLHEAELDDLPDGAFVLEDAGPSLVLGAALLPWSAAGYRERRLRPSGPARLVTPPSLVEILRRGWASSVPVLHPTARA